MEFIENFDMKTLFLNNINSSVTKQKWNSL